MSTWKVGRKAFPSPHVAVCWLPFSADHSEQYLTLKSCVLRRCVICISDTYWVPRTPHSYKATLIEPAKHPLGGRWKIWLLTSWGQCSEPSSGTPSHNSFLWNQSIHHYVETCSLLTPQLHSHSKCGYHKILENSPNYYNFKKTPQSYLVTWHMVQNIWFSVLCTLMLVIVPESSFLPSLFAELTRTCLGLSDKCLKSASSSVDWNLAG